MNYVTDVGKTMNDFKFEGGYLTSDMETSQGYNEIKKFLQTIVCLLVPKIMRAGLLEVFLHQ